jgi:dCTP deaminase
MSIMSDIWIEEQCSDPSIKWRARLEYLREQLPQVKSQPNIYRSFSDEYDTLNWKLAEFQKQQWLPMIEPFHRESVRTRVTNVGTTDENVERILSFGLSSYGYDVTLAEEFKIFTNINCGIIDPHNFRDDHYVDVKGPHAIIPPNGFLLGVTREYFRIPRNVLVICLGKSTLARCGAIVNVTPLEPEWEGKVVIEISNTTNLPLKIYANEGVAQFLFLKGDQACRTSYKDRKGKYQGQNSLVVAKV